MQTIGTLHLEIAGRMRNAEDRPLLMPANGMKNDPWAYWSMEMPREMPFPEPEHADGMRPPTQSVARIRTA